MDFPSGGERKHKSGGDTELSGVLANEWLGFAIRREWKSQ